MYIKSQLQGCSSDLSTGCSSDLSTAQAKIAVLESMVDSLMKAAAGNKKRVLLAEVAFMLDEVASDFVIGSDEDSYTVGELLRMAENELESEQHQRWDRFCTFLRQSALQPAWHHRQLYGLRPLQPRAAQLVASGVAHAHDLHALTFGFAHACMCVSQCQ